MEQRRMGWPWKKEFACHRCGNCCRGEGYVEVTEGDIDRAARYLGMSVEAFMAEYVISERGGQYGLKHQGDPLQSCIFLTEENGLFGCRIHGAKPEQCGAFPFTWRPRDAVEFCEGLRALEGLGKPARKSMSRDLERRLAREERGK